MDKLLTRITVLRARLLFVGLIAGSILCPLAVQGADWDSDLSLTLESRGTYDDNVFLTTRRSEEVDLEDPNRPGLFDPGTSDLFGRVYADLRLDYSLKEGKKDILLGSLEYYHGRQYYSTEDTENNYRHGVTGDLEFPLAEHFSLRLFGGGEWDERRSSAAYGLLDYAKYWGGVQTRWDFHPAASLKTTYEIGTKDYDSASAGVVASYHDYDWHQVSGKLTVALSKSWSLEPRASYRWRDYDQDARNGIGRTIIGRDRDDKYLETGVQLTGALTPKTALRLGYYFNDNQSTGPYYRYDRHRVFGLLLQELTKQTSAYVFLQRQWKNYDDQVAFEDPLGTRLQQGEREDREWLVLVGAECAITRQLTLFTEYSHTSNDSNDDTSEYDGNQYSVGMRWKF